jgi:hypothetical protein
VKAVRIHEQGGPDVVPEARAALERGEQVGKIVLRIPA